jgi:hypothetical protein
LKVGGVGVELSEFRIERCSGGSIEKGEMAL